MISQMAQVSLLGFQVLNDYSILVCTNSKISYLKVVCCVFRICKESLRI